MIDYKALAEWALSGQTGLSSKFMAAFLSGMKFDSFRSHPSDSGDFKRCIGLLNAVPSLRNELPRMAEASPYWEALVSNWDRLERCEDGKRYELMRSILDPVQKRDSNSIRLSDAVTFSTGSFKRK